jgi:hypothetical protein
MCLQRYANSGRESSGRVQYCDAIMMGFVRMNADEARYILDCHLPCLIAVRSDAQKVQDLCFATEKGERAMSGAAPGAPRSNQFGFGLSRDTLYATFLQPSGFRCRNLGGSETGIDTECVGPGARFGLRGATLDRIQIRWEQEDDAGYDLAAQLADRFFVASDKKLLDKLMLESARMADKAVRSGEGKPLALQTARLSNSTAKMFVTKSAFMLSITVGSDE